MPFDYAGAKNAGYSDEEIDSYLTQQYPKFDFEGAKKAGYSLDEISSYLESDKSAETKQESPQTKTKLTAKQRYKERQQKNFDEKNNLQKKTIDRSFLEKTQRVGKQLGLGVLENITSTYDIPMSTIASKEAQFAKLRENIFDDIANLELIKSTGKADEKDLELLDDLKTKIKNPKEIEKYVNTLDLTTRGVLGNILDDDFHAEGIAEKTAHWLGFLKDPKKGFATIKELGLNPRKLIKTIIPGEKFVQSTLAGTALQMAENNQFGPLGYLASGLIGVAGGHGITSGSKTLVQAAKNPKEALAKATNFLTRANSKKEIIKSIVETAKESGIDLDAGTLTQSDLVRYIQAYAKESGLTGNKLSEFKDSLIQQVVDSYSEIAKTVGENIFENSHEASTALKNYLNAEQKQFRFFTDYDKPARSLVGRIAVEDVSQQSKSLEEIENNFLNKITNKPVKDDFTLGKSLKETAQEIKEPIKKSINKEWDEFSKKVSHIQSPQIALVQNLKNFYNENKGSLSLPSYFPERKLLLDTMNLIQKLYAKGSYLETSVAELIKTKQTLARIPNWKLATGELKNKYKKLVGYIDESIVGTLKSLDQELVAEYKNLNKDYTKYKELFENQNVSKLYNPTNRNFNSLYSDYVRSPDKLRALKEIFSLDAKGDASLRAIKKDRARKIIQKKNLTEKDIENLKEVLGKEHEKDFVEFLSERDELTKSLKEKQKNSLQPKKQKSLPVKPEFERNLSGKPIQRNISKSELQARKKAYNLLKNKDSKQLLNWLDSIDNLKYLNNLLGYTKEGQDLYKNLVRFKLDSMINESFSAGIKENISFSKFIDIFKDVHKRSLIKEIVGKEAYDKLISLKKNSEALEQSIIKMNDLKNFSTSTADISTYVTGIIGILTGNPFLTFSSLASAASVRVASILLSDKEFLSLLEKVVISDNARSYNEIFQKMRPRVRLASIESQKEMIREKDQSEKIE